MGQDATPPAPAVPGGIPRGIEILVKKASVDAAFRSLLLARPVEAAAQIALELDAAERLILQAVPRGQLETIIARATVPEEHRRAFLGQVAAAMLAVLGLGPSGVQAQSVYQGPGGIGGMIGPMPPRFIPPPPNPMPADNAGRVIAVIADLLHVDRKTVTQEKSLVKDLHVKPAQMVHLRKALAAEFRMYIPATAFSHVHTVGGTVELIEKAFGKPPAPVFGSGGMRPDNPPSAPQGLMTRGGVSMGGGMGGGMGMGP